MGKRYYNHSYNHSYRNNNYHQPRYNNYSRQPQVIQPQVTVAMPEPKTTPLGERIFEGAANTLIGVVANVAVNILAMELQKPAQQAQAQPAPPTPPPYRQAEDGRWYDDYGNEVIPRNR